jgi:hypothetical protein
MCSAEFLAGGRAGFNVCGMYQILLVLDNFLIKFENHIFSSGVMALEDVKKSMKMFLLSH